MTKAPVDTAVIVGESATFPCQTNLTGSNAFVSIEWRHLPVDFLVHDPAMGQGYIVYHYGIVIERYSSRFSVSFTSDGDANLSIMNTGFKDAGVYICREITKFNTGITGESKSANLTVLGKICWSSIFQTRQQLSEDMPNRN